MKNIHIVGEFALKIDIDPEVVQPADIFKRAEEADFPYWNHDGSRLTKSQVIDHLTHNAITNGVTDISTLDGYADFPRGAVTLRVIETNVDRWLADG